MLKFKIPFINRIKGHVSNIVGDLPFIHLLGHEKVWGTPRPNDFKQMVQKYHSWAYACAWKNATSVAKSKLKLFKTAVIDGKTELVEVDDHIFLDLVKEVNPFSNRFELLTITQIYLELTGNAYWWIPRNEIGVPHMIWNIPADWVSIVPHEENFINGYVVQVPNSGKKIPFDEHEIVHFKFPSPFSLYYGTSPLWAARFAIDLNENSKRWGINYFLNNAQPGGILTSEQGIGDQEFKRLKDQWNRKHRGTENASRLAILGSGLKYQQIGSSIKDVKFPEMSKSNRDEILAMFGVPASKLGLVEDVNRANAEANDYTYQKETIVPRLTLIEEKLNEKVIPIYDPKLTIKFDNPVPDDNSFRLEEKRLNIAMGYSSIDDERKIDGLDPYDLPETRVPLIPFNLTPAGEEDREPDDPGTSSHDLDDDKSIRAKRQKARADSKWLIFSAATSPQERILKGIMRRFFEKQHSEVMQNFNKFRSVKGDNPLTKDLLGEIQFNQREANANLAERTKRNIRSAYVTGLEIAGTEVNNQIDLELFEPNIAKAVEQRTSFFVQKTNESTAAMITKTVREGLEKGESITEIGTRLDKVYSFRENFSSKTVAQTEVIGATNAGQLMAYQEAGITDKEWLTARDEKVRSSHKIDGQTVPISETFVTGDGNQLNYPGDRTSGAPAGDVINCRCTVLAIV